MRQNSSRPELLRENDKRITPWGRILRMTFIDELPQIINIIKGDMSLVGPRPEVPYFHRKFCREVPGWEKRLQVKPGMTGWAQVHGISSFTPRQKLKYDLEYIQKKSFWFDCWIVILTFLALIKKIKYTIFRLLLKG